MNVTFLFKANFIVNVSVPHDSLVLCNFVQFIYTKCLTFLLGTLIPFSLYIIHTKEYYKTNTYFVLTLIYITYITNAETCKIH